MVIFRHRAISPYFPPVLQILGGKTLFFADFKPFKRQGGILGFLTLFVGFSHFFALILYDI
jgi:hypothetical protein